MAVSGLPPMQAIATCSPGDGGNHTLKSPARVVFQRSQPVSSSPLRTRTHQDSSSTSEMIPVRMILLSSRMSSALIVQPPQSGPAPCYKSGAHLPG
ncbi:Uncharacterised protein [Shigella sonnei]|nr:Uncharacterised protein [Shigella sonnei]